MEQPRSASEGHLRPEQAQPLAVASVAAAEVLAAFPEVVCSSKVLPKVKHKVEHVIELTTERPISSRYRRLAPQRLQEAKEEFREMERQGLIQRSKGSWASALRMVEKADGMWRPCGDYRRLNMATKLDLYLPPHMEDMAARLAGKTIFSKLAGPQKGLLAGTGGQGRCGQDGRHHPLWTV